MTFLHHEVSRYQVVTLYSLKLLGDLLLKSKRMLGALMSIGIAHYSFQELKRTARRPLLPLVPWNAPRLLGPEVAPEVCITNTHETCLWSDIFYKWPHHSGLLWFWVLSVEKAHFSANGIHLGSRTRNSKFKCWCFGLIQAKWSFWEKHKIGKPLFNGRWLIGADSLRAITMTTSEASTLL